MDVDVDDGDGDDDDDVDEDDDDDADDECGQETALRKPAFWAHTGLYQNEELTSFDSSFDFSLDSFPTGFRRRAPRFFFGTAKNEVFPENNSKRKLIPRTAISHNN